MLAITEHRLVLHTASFTSWVLAAAGIGYWALQISANGGQVNQPVSTTAFTASGSAIDPGMLARLLGGLTPQAAAPISNSSRFVLKGVVSGALGQEAALIAIDDKPAKAFRVGTSIEEGLLLQSASSRKVTLSATKEGPALITLEMPALGK